MCTDDMKVDVNLPRKTKEIGERGSGKKVKVVLEYMKGNIPKVHDTIYVSVNGLTRPE